MASSTDDYNETEGFDDYNPHPYQGGYDMALTYGHPLPPSPATCYPIISTSSSSLPLPLPLPFPSPPTPPPPPPPLLQPLPLPLPSPPPPTLTPPPPLLQPLPPYDHGHGHSDCSPDLYQYGFWPFLSPEEEKSRGDDAAAEFGYWNQWRRAGEYLFGCSEGLGERRIGVDSYGIPIYADKIHALPPLTLHFEPDSVNRRLDHYRTNYEHDHDDDWFKVERKDGDRHYYYYEEEPIRVQHSNVGITMPLSLTYHEEDYEEQVDHHAEWHSSYTEGGNGNDFYGHPQHDYERHLNEHHSCVELEPYKPTWSQNLSYQEIYEGEASSQSYWHSSSYDETGDVSHSIRHHDLKGERYYHEQLHSFQLEPFKPAWTQNPNFYQPFTEVSHSSLVDDSREDSNKYFSSFLEYSQYDE